MKIYVDTCVYLDLFEGRKDRLRDLGEFALQLFRRVEEGEFTLIVSDLVMEELAYHVSKERIDEFFDDLYENIINIFTSKDERIQARNWSKRHYKDALHAALAQKAQADCLVTRNMKDFLLFPLSIKLVFPENI